MPLFHSHTIDENTRLAVWQISEPEDFFLEKVPVSRSITHPHKRLQHLAGRYLLQYLFPDFPLQLIQIADTRKPFLASESHHFSISHCGDYAAAIVSTQKRVGIDVELHSERIERIQQKFLNAHEWELAKTAGPLFPTMIWSAKESMFKWYSLGEVDFQEHLRILELNEMDATQGTLTVAFTKKDHHTLVTNYRIWGNLVLTWI